MDKWQEKFKKQKAEIKECREVIVLYEGLMNKLTEQNNKLKSLNRSRKSSRNRHESISFEAKALVQNNPEKSIFDNITIVDDCLSGRGFKSARSDSHRVVTHPKKDSKLSQSPKMSARAQRGSHRPRSSLTTHRATISRVDVISSKHPSESHGTN